MFREFDICRLQNLVNFNQLNNTLCVYLYKNNLNHFIYVSNEKSIRSLNISSNFIEYDNSRNINSNCTFELIDNVKKYIKLHHSLHIIRMYDDNISIFNSSDNYNLSQFILNNCDTFWDNNKIYNIINDNPLAKIILEEADNLNIDITQLLAK